LYNLGIRLAAAGRRTEALDPAREAVTLFRQLADTNPTIHVPRLALSLYNLGIRLAAAGRHVEALDPAREAVTIRRQLAELDPANLPDLAESLRAYGRLAVRTKICLPDALTAVSEALRHFEPLAKRSPEMYRPWWREAMRTLAEILNGQGRATEAAIAWRYLGEEAGTNTPRHSG
jgi:tetratricopeptide (TPR) repeat protein